jgi:hypothetical protein
MEERKLYKEKYTRNSEKIWARMKKSWALFLKAWYIKGIRVFYLSASFDSEEDKKFQGFDYCTSK